VDGTAKNEISPAAAQRAGTPQVFRWFTRILPQSFFESLKEDLGIIENSCIFTLPVTTWLMILQRLSASGTLVSAVAELIQGHGRQLLEPCKRVRQDSISANSGAYSQARQRVPVQAVRRVAERVFEYLYEISAGEGLRSRLFVLDGSSIRLAHTPAIIKLYPVAENQYGESHWPVMRVAVMHHVATGLAMAPQYGAMYGADAVSEQDLAEELIERLPPRSVLIGDRNFGVFGVAFGAHRRGHTVVVRLTAARAKRLLEGGEPPVDSEQPVVWQPSRDDLRAHPELTAEDRIKGRLIVTQPDHAREILYLFTTLEQSREEATALYKERWNIETDLRSLKEQVRLHTIPARSPDLAASELLIAVASYNLIRAVMAEAARQIGIEPRRLSFSRSREAFWAFVRAAAHVESGEAFERHWRLLLRSIGQSRLPTRDRPPAPRLVWRKPHGFPYRNTPRDASKI